LDDHATAAVLHGNAIAAESAVRRPSPLAPRPEEARFYARDGRMLALARYDARRDMWQPGKVFGAPSVSRAVTPSVEIG